MDEAGSKDGVRIDQLAVGGALLQDALAAKAAWSAARWKGRAGREALAHAQGRRLLQVVAARNCRDSKSGPSDVRGSAPVAQQLYFESEQSIARRAADASSGVCPPTGYRPPLSKPTSARAA
jgi:hypothetical protein